jgi:hypothetical protein
LQEKCVAYHTEAPFAVDGFPDVQVHKDIWVSDITLFSCF